MIYRKEARTAAITRVTAAPLKGTCARAPLLEPVADDPAAVVLDVELLVPLRALATFWKAVKLRADVSTELTAL